MEEQRKREIIEEVQTAYNSRGAPGLRDFIESYQGSSEEKTYLEKIEQDLGRRSSKGALTRVQGLFDSSLIEELLALN